MSDERHAQIMAETEVVRERRAMAAGVGAVDGRQYWEWVSEIDALRRAGDLEAALELTHRCLDAAKRIGAVWGEPFRANAMYERAATILRKIGDLDAEVLMLEIAVEADPQFSTRLAKRLEAARQLRSKRST